MGSLSSEFIYVILIVVWVLANHATSFFMVFFSILMNAHGVRTTRILGASKEDVVVLIVASFDHEPTTEARDFNTHSSRVDE